MFDTVCQVRMSRFELPFSRVTGERVSPLHHTPIFKALAGFGEHLTVTHLLRGKYLAYLTCHIAELGFEPR